MIQAGNPSLGNALLPVANPALATVWIADRSWALANKPVVERWSAGLRQAAAFIEKNPQEARQVLEKYTKLPAPVIENIALPHFEASLRPSELEVWIAVLRNSTYCKGRSTQRRSWQRRNDDAPMPVFELRADQDRDAGNRHHVPVGRACGAPASGHRGVFAALERAIMPRWPTAKDGAAVKRVSSRRRSANPS